MSTTADNHGNGELDNEAAMQIALGLAHEAGQAGEVPIGALVIMNGEIVSARRNERQASNDPTAHAEVLALREAAAKLGTSRLDGATLVSTLEPCPMCAGAAWLARVQRVVFGAHDPKGGALGSLYNIGADPRLNHEIEVVSRVAEAECSAILSDWFAARR